MTTYEKNANNTYRGDEKEGKFLKKVYSNKKRGTGSIPERRFGVAKPHGIIKKLNLECSGRIKEM